MSYLNFYTNEILTREEAIELCGSEEKLKEYEAMAVETWENDPHDIAQFSNGLEIGE